MDDDGLHDENDDHGIREGDPTNNGGGIICEGNSGGAMEGSIHRETNLMVKYEC